jgi:hypothetical protein
MQETFQAVGSIFGGKAAKAQAYSEADLAERQAQDVDLQALQTSEARRGELRSALATIEARRAESGLGLDSPSADAIRTEMQRQSARGESIDQVGFGNQRTSLLTSAKMKRAYGSAALTTGYLNAGAYLASGGQKIAKAVAGGG